jgi:hypothetical protein
MWIRPEDMARILNPEPYTPEELARRERTLARVRYLETLILELGGLLSNGP